VVFLRGHPVSLGSEVLLVLDATEKEAADGPWTLAATAMLTRDLELAILLQNLR